MFTVGVINDRPQTTAKPKRATNGRPYKRISAGNLFSLPICGIMELTRSLSLRERWRRSRRQGNRVRRSLADLPRSQHAGIAPRRYASQRGGEADRGAPKRKGRTTSRNACDIRIFLQKISHRSPRSGTVRSLCPTIRHARKSVHNLFTSVLLSFLRFRLDFSRAMRYNIICEFLQRPTRRVRNGEVLKRPKRRPC